MLKRIIAAIAALAIIFTTASSTGVFAAEKAYTGPSLYVQQGNYGGYGTADAPLATVEDAISRMNGSSGTIYIVGRYNMSDITFEKWNGTITFTGVSDESSIVIDAGKYVNFNGSLRLADINLEMGEWSFIGNIGEKTVIENVNMPSNTMFHSGVLKEGLLDNTDVTLESGHINNIHLGGAYVLSSASGVVNDVNLTVNGGRINNVYLNADKYSEEHGNMTVGGNVNIVINGGTVDNIDYLEATAMEVVGALNIIYNNGTASVPSINLPTQNFWGGVYTIYSGIGGKVLPTEDEGYFELVADKDKIAVINGEYIKDGIISLENGESCVTWADYSDYEDLEESKHNKLYPSKEDFPEGVEGINNEELSDEEKYYPLNTDFEDVLYTKDIDTSLYNGQVSLSEQAHSGKFSLSVSATNDAYLPVKATEEFYVGKDNYISTNGISLKKHALKANLAKLYINPGDYAESISFYLSSENDGNTEYHVIKSDVSGDGVFTIGEDFSQGKWQEITLDLLKVSPELKNGKATGLFVTANTGSTFLLDDITSDYVVVNHITPDLSALAKDNLEYSEDSLKLSSETDEEGKVTYDIDPVITTNEVLLNDHISGISMVVSDTNEKHIEPKHKESEFLLPYDVANMIDASGWQGEYNHNAENKYVHFAEATVTFNFELPETEYRYKMYLDAELISGADIDITFSNGYAFTLKYDNTDHYEIILPNNIGNSMTIASAYSVYIYGIDFTILEYDSMSDSLHEFYDVKTVYTYDDTSLSELGVDIGALSAIEDCRGTNEGQYFSSTKGPIAVRVVYTGDSSQATLNVQDYGGDYTKNFLLGYGECEYIIDGNPHANYNKFGIYNDSSNALVTSVTQYTPKVSSSNTASTHLVNLGKDAVFSVHPANNYATCIVDDKVYKYTFDNKELALLHTDYEFIDMKISPNGRYVCYQRDLMWVLYDIVEDRESLTIYDYEDEILRIDNNGVIYYTDEYDNLYSSDEFFNGIDIPIGRMVFSDSGDYLIFLSTSDSTTENPTYTYNIYKKGDTSWYFSQTLSFDKTYGGEIIDIRDNLIYTTNTKINIDTGNAVKYDFDGTLLTIDGAKMFFTQSGEDMYLMYDTETEKSEVYTIPDVATIYGYDEFHNSIIYRNYTYTDDTNTLYAYNTLSNDSMVKTVLSFDGGKEWYAYSDGSWESVYSGGIPDAETMNAHGMTVSELCSLGEEEYDKFYSDGASVYSVKMAILVTSKSESLSPVINGITVDTVSHKEDKYLYSAKYKEYSKDEYERINKLLVFDGTQSNTEVYYLLSIGKNWLYTYKSGEIVKLPRVENGLLSDIDANWITFKQYGMTEGEVNKLPVSILNEIFLGEDNANTEFGIVYVYKTLNSSTKGTDFEVKMLFDAKITSPEEYTVTLYMNDGTTRTYDQTMIDYETVLNLLEWLGSTEGSSVKDFYMFEIGGVIQFVGRKNISYIDIGTNG